MTEGKLSLDELGWGEFFAQQVNDQALIPARVYRQETDAYLLFSEHGRLVGRLPGRARRTSAGAHKPTVGDWVFVRPVRGDASDQVMIEQRLGRRTVFSRKRAGGTDEEQVIAANIDTVFVVAGLDGDFNRNRIERYLVLAAESGAAPVIVLNKADLVGEPPLDQLREVVKDVPVLVISAKHGDGMNELHKRIRPRETAAFIGSSGVGKSTIINHLLGHERFKTGAVRTADSKGRHTTTFREMVPLEAGGLIIDTPGMREVHLWGDESSLEQQFDDIEALALECRFSDCRHDTEPGCAVRQAISDGSLDGDKLARYTRLHAEVRGKER